MKKNVEGVSNKSRITAFLVILCTALLMFVFASCQKEKLVDLQKPESLATAVLKFKGSGENILEKDMYGVFDASQSQGNDPSIFTWFMGDNGGAQITGYDKFAYKYEDIGNYQIMLMVVDSLGNEDYAFMDIEVVEPGSGFFEAEQVILCSVLGPDSSGQFIYEIGARLSYCPAIAGEYFYGIFSNQCFDKLPFERFEEIRGEEYGIFTVTGYNQLLQWTYGKDYQEADLSQCIHYDESSDMLLSTLKDAEFLPLNQISNILPGDLDWDDVLRYSIDEDSNKGIFYVNSLKYCGDNLNNPWFEYSSDNENWVKVYTQFLGGTGWSQVSVDLDNFIESNGTIFVRFGDNENEIGQIEQSQFYLDIYQSIVLKNFQI